MEAVPRKVSLHPDMVKRRQSQVPPGGLGPNPRRKQSMWRGSISEASATTPPSNQVKAVLENTYRLEPAESERFKYFEVQKVIKAVLAKCLSDLTYDASTCAERCKEISQQITQEVKELGVPRHKIITHVLILEQKEQGFQVASRSLWNPNTDSYASAEYKNAHLCATAMVHGVYYE